MQLPSTEILWFDDIDALGVRSWKLAGTVSSEYSDNSYKKVIYAECFGRDVDLLEFETQSESLELKIHEIVEFMKKFMV